MINRAFQEKADTVARYIADTRRKHYGFVSVPRVLTAAECDQLVEAYIADSTYRKTISMQRYRFGSGHGIRLEVVFY